MADTKKETTKKPSGLTVARNGDLKFACSWKVADSDYGAGYQFRYRVWTSSKKYGKWTSSNLSSDARSKTVTFSTSNYAPNSNKPKFYAFEYEVRGKRNQTTQNNVTTVYSWSAWAGKKWILAVPNRPDVTEELTQSNITEFTWRSSKSNSDNKPFANYRYQSFLMKECKETDGSKLNWKSSNRAWTTATVNSDSSVSIEDDSTILATNSWTRWFRIWSQGPAGNSAWRYSKHVYAHPRKATIQSVTAKQQSSVTNIIIKWAASANAAYPIDEVIAEYSFAVPDTGLTIPAGASWNTGATVSDTSGTDAVNFIANNILGDDQCLFVRVKTKHDANEAVSNYKVALMGDLKKPTTLDVTLGSNYKAAISVTNNSTVPDARVAIVYRGTNGKEITVAVTSAGNGAKTLSNIQCPSTSSSAKFYAYAFQGTYTQKTRSDGVSSYAINANMTSGNVFDSASAPDVPVAPDNVTVTASGNDAVVAWSWSWADADNVVISWSTDKNAWQSTEEPKTYTVENSWATKWRVANITPGAVWYFRLRFIDTSVEPAKYGPWSDVVSLDKTAAPDQPILGLSAGAVKPGGKIKASWTYSSPDGIAQASAEVRETTNNGVVATTTTKKTVTIPLSGWTSGTTYNLQVRVTSKTGRVSDWSDPVPFYIGEKPVCAITATNIAPATITDDDGETRTVDTLSVMPLTATVTGAGAGGTTSLIIERAKDYHVERPDGTARDGFEGETICVYQQTGEGGISIDQQDLVGTLDDGAGYNLIVSVDDGNGQTDTLTQYFEVHWGYQPEIPVAAVTIEDGVAVITMTIPEDLEAGDVVDIYRLSVDNPQLIVQGGSYYTGISDPAKYVDPYPALGPAAGYRVVAVSKYGDYITADQTPAWLDLPINIDNKIGYIHFNGEVIAANLNVELSGTWNKDFKETRYLGGTIRGDWNLGVSRQTTVNVTIPTEDTATIQSMRRLADYTGICHVRTQDGSSFAANIQVSGNTGYGVAGKVETYTLNITRIAPQALDGLPYSEYFPEDEE